jgi:ADP-dependent NAD(P)H-hydrate dehydratase
MTGTRNRSDTTPLFEGGRARNFRSVQPLSQTSSSQTPSSQTNDPSRRPRDITPRLLRDWPLPTPAGSKYSRGQIVVIGGAPRSPGAALLAGEAALRAGGGRLTLAVGSSVAAQVAVALPECGVVPLDETEDHHIRGGSARAAEEDIRGADAILVGPGLDDADEAVALLELLPELASEDAVIVLDAFALGVLPRVSRSVQAFADRLILTPNRAEAERLAGHPIGDLAEELPPLANAHRAVLSCENIVARPGGELWSAATGTVGLATSGSGDVLAGGIAGLAGRGASPEQAAVWGTYLHATAGDLQATRLGPIGFLARELLLEYPRLLDRLRPE